MSDLKTEVLVSPDMSLALRRRQRLAGGRAYWSATINDFSVHPIHLRLSTASQYSLDGVKAGLESYRDFFLAFVGLLEEDIKELNEVIASKGETNGTED